MIKKVFTLLLLVTPAFASLHYVSQTLKPTAKVAYAGAKFTSKQATFPIRHPFRTAKGAAKGVSKAVTTTF